MSDPRDPARGEPATPPIDPIHDLRYAPPQADVRDIPDTSDGPLLATRGRRLGAALIDVAIALLLMVVLSRLTPWRPFDDEGRSLWDVHLANVAIGYVLFVVAHGYTLATRGQTLGKVATGIRIVRPDGSPASIARLLGVRYGLFSLANLVPAIGQIVGLVDALCIFRKSRRCLHDQVADTIVVRI